VVQGDFRLSFLVDKCTLELISTLIYSRQYDSPICIIDRDANKIDSHSTFALAVLGGGCRSIKNIDDEVDEWYSDSVNPLAVVLVVEGLRRRGCTVNTASYAFWRMYDHCPVRLTRPGYRDALIQALLDDGAT
jgi:hypothetical protein